MVDIDLLSKKGGIIGAEKVSSVWCNAQAKVSDAHLQLCLTHNVGNGGSNARVDLCGVVAWCVRSVKEVDEEDAGYQRRT